MAQVVNATISSMQRKRIMGLIWAAYFREPYGLAFPIQGVV